MKKVRIQYKKGDIIGKCIFVEDTKINIIFDGKRKRHHRYCNFLCECGNIFESNIDWIKQERTKSCGCLNRRLALLKLPSPLRHGHSITGSQTPEYNAWRAMKSRCFGKNEIHQKQYRNKGITVCDRWKTSFENFFKDMGYKPDSSYSLDRIDSNGNYSPENCRWATIKEQNSNKSNNIMITYEDKTQCLQHWAKELNINPHTLNYRIANKWPLNRAFVK